jgi:hypothetical protein
MNVTMTKDEADHVLSKLEANNWADLFRSRWDHSHAEKIVPMLLSCLEVEDVSILHRALSALHRIGPEAHNAIDRVIRLMEHQDKLICEVAIYTLASISFRCPERAIGPLTQMAAHDEFLKPALFSLIALGRGAASAAEVFISAFNSRDARIRRLALRGLTETGADATSVQKVLSRALNDRNGQVRSAAERLAQRFRNEL